MLKIDTLIEQIRDIVRAKSMIDSLYLKFAVKILTLLRARIAKFPSILPVLLKYLFFAILFHLQCINIRKANKRYAYLAKLPATICVQLCGIMFKQVSTRFSVACTKTSI